MHRKIFMSLDNVKALNKFFENTLDKYLYYNYKASQIILVIKADIKKSEQPRLLQCPFNSAKNLLLFNSPK